MKLDLKSTSSSRVTSPVTSFPAVWWILQSRQSFSPHRSQFNRVQHTLNHTTWAASSHHSPAAARQRGTGSPRQREVRSEALLSTMLLLVAVAATRGGGRDLTSGASQSHSQHSPTLTQQHNNTTSSVQHIRGTHTGRTGGSAVCRQPTRLREVSPNVTKIKKICQMISLKDKDRNALVRTHLQEKESTTKWILSVEFLWQLLFHGSMGGEREREKLKGANDDSLVINSFH